MDMGLIGVAVVGGVVLAALWISHLRRDLARRQARSADFDGVEDHTPALWTSAARCPECQEGGALLSREDAALVHTCLSCGHRHVREHRG